MGKTVEAIALDQATKCPLRGQGIGACSRREITVKCRVEAGNHRKPRPERSQCPKRLQCCGVVEWGKVGMSFDLSENRVVDYNRNSKMRSPVNEAHPNRVRIFGSIQNMADSLNRINGCFGTDLESDAVFKFVAWTDHAEFERGGAGVDDKNAHSSLHYAASAAT